MSAPSPPSSPPRKRQRTAAPTVSSSTLRGPATFAKPDELSDFSTILKDLNDAAKLVAPSGTAYYTRAVVLAFEWQIGDKNVRVASSRDKVLHTFEELYGFEVKRYKIEEGHAQVAEAYDRFELWLNLNMRNHQGTSPTDRSLILLFYTGHGDLYQGHFHLFAKPEDRLGRKPYVINYETIAASFRHKLRDETDMAAIFDCYAAGTAHIDENVELPGACSWESEASGAELQNFTLDINNILRNTWGTPKTLAELYCDLCKKARIRNFPNPQPVHRRSADPERPSVVLKSIKQAAPSPTPKITAKTQEVRITIAITITDVSSIPSASEFRKWILANIPPGIQGIEFRGDWETISKLVVLVLPAEIWLFLQDRWAYRYLAHEISA